jgi:putative Ca2+/H+ antiporter (TMEM165/GDT1 family)
MDWKLFITTFVTIFLAELGDKTQFAAVAASAKSSSTRVVFAAVVSALALAGGLGVFAGKALGEVFNPQWLKILSGSLFIFVGMWVLLSKN